MPRKAMVVTTCMHTRFGPSIEDNRAAITALLKKAAAYKPDIICLPETWSDVGVNLPLAQRAETVPGPATDLCSRYARELSTYIICPIHANRGGILYNSAVLINRKGEIVGIYDKAHPVTSESDFTALEHGIQPGGEPPVFELDFGTIGIQICFDIQFPETWTKLGQQGVEMIFWASAYDGGFPLQAYALQESCYVVSSVRTSHSRIINPLAEVLLDTTRRTDVIGMEIDCDFMVSHSDYHYGMWEAIKERYGNDINIRHLNEEGLNLIHSASDSLELADIIKEYGLGSVRDYIDRHRQAQTALRQGETAEAQGTPYLGRPPYTPVSYTEWKSIRG